MKRLRILPLIAALAFPVTAFADDIQDLMERGRWKEARAAVETLVKAKPNDARAVGLMSRVKLAFNSPDEALALAEKAVTLDPKSADAHYQLASVCGSMAQRAGKLKAFSLARRLRKEAEQALAIDPGHLDARETLMQFYSLAPGIVGGDDKKAAAMAEEITKVDRARGLLAQAELAARAKKPQGAAALYDQAVEADPSSYGARMTLARYLSDDGRKQYDQAEKHARAAIAIDPGRAGGYSMLAALHVLRERWTDLDAILAESERQVPGNLIPHYTAARTLIVASKDLPRAERYLRQYLAHEPEGGAPSPAHAHWRLGNALEKQGRNPEAVKELEASLAINPQLDEAKKDLKRLKRG